LVGLEKKEFAGKLEKIREIRNDVMHFNPDPLDAEQLFMLQRFASFYKGCVTYVIPSNVETVRGHTFLDFFDPSPARMPPPVDGYSPKPARKLRLANRKPRHIRYQSKSICHRD
jgi:hypothetical protein